MVLIIPTEKSEQVFENTGKFWLSEEPFEADEDLHGDEIYCHMTGS